MLTFFTTAKPFHGHDGIIQRNAITSWTLLHPGVEVILFGNEEGAADAANEFGLRHEPHVERNEFGTKRLDFMVCKAQAIARHDLLLLHQLRHHADAGIFRRGEARAREAFAVPDGGTPLGCGNQYAFESWEQGLAAAVTRTSCAERTAARAGMD